MTSRDHLAAIVRSKRVRVESAKRRMPLAQLKAELTAPVRRHDFPARLHEGPPAFVCEIKRGSPSRGLFAPHLRPAEYARELEAGGAAAISVITEEDHFHAIAGSLSLVRAAVGLPLLKKDFLFDPWQLYEAKHEGADLVLLLVSLLDGNALRDLVALTDELGMDALVEVHDERELEIALGSGAKIVGINNRNLRDFSVNLATTERLRPMVPPECAVIAESGIHSEADVVRLARARVHGFLIGESLIRHPSPRTFLEALRRATEAS